MFAIAVAVALIGMTLAARVAHGALPTRASDDPTPTTSTPTPTTPDPDPAPPPPKPKAQPKPKPAPRPSPSPTPTPTPSPVVPSTPPASAPPQSVTPKVTHHKPLKHKRARPKHHPPVAKPKPQFVTPLVPVGAKSGASQAPATKPDLAKLMIFGTLGLSLLLFALAALPARAVPWRPAAYFISHRQIDLTLFGIVLFALTIVEIVVTRN